MFPCGKGGQASECGFRAVLLAPEQRVRYTIPQDCYVVILYLYLYVCVCIYTYIERERGRERERQRDTLRAPNTEQLVV